MTSSDSLEKTPQILQDLPRHVTTETAPRNLAMLEELGVFTLHRLLREALAEICEEYTPASAEAFERGTPRERAQAVRQVLLEWDRLHAAWVKNIPQMARVLGAIAALQENRKLVRWRGREAVRLARIAVAALQARGEGG